MVLPDSPDRQDEIVAAALVVLAQTSLDALTTRNVASRLGLSQPALFRHFRNRDELVAAVIAKAKEELARVGAASLGGPGSTSLVRLHDFASALAEAIERNPALGALVFSASIPSEDRTRSAALASLASMLKNLATGLIQEGQLLGEIRGDADGKVLATLYLGILQACILDWQITGRPKGLPGTIEAPLSLWTRMAMPASRDPEPGELADPTASPNSAAVDRWGVLELDARPMLERGEDPLGSILSALATLKRGGLLVLYAPFRPSPLVALLERRGHTVSVEEPSPGLHLAVVVAGGGLEVEDLRDLEPPEPLERVLVAGGKLKPGEVFIARVPRRPTLLLARLAERGVPHQILELPDTSALVRLEGRL